MKETRDMLTHRHGSWSTVRESFRRERRINDLLNASSQARLHQRVAVSGVPGTAWNRVETELRSIEHAIRRLDPIEPGFWDGYRTLEDELVSRFAEAGVAFDVHRVISS